MIKRIKQVFNAPAGYEIVYQPNQSDEARYPLQLLAICEVNMEVNDNYSLIVDKIVPIDVAYGSFDPVEGMDFEIQEVNEKV